VNKILGVIMMGIVGITGPSAGEQNFEYRMPYADGEVTLPDDKGTIYGEFLTTGAAMGEIEGFSLSTAQRILSTIKGDRPPQLNLPWPIPVVEEYFRNWHARKCPFVVHPRISWNESHNQLVFNGFGCYEHDTNKAPEELTALEGFPSLDCEITLGFDNTDGLAQIVDSALFWNALKEQRNAIEAQDVPIELQENVEEDPTQLESAYSAIRAMPSLAWPLISCVCCACAIYSGYKWRSAEDEVSKALAKRQTIGWGIALACSLPPTSYSIYYHFRIKKGC
jgi:hypothetical protein